MSEAGMLAAAAAAGAAMGHAIGVFMVHPETFAQSIAGTG